MIALRRVCTVSVYGLAATLGAMTLPLSLASTVIFDLLAAGRSAGDPSQSHRRRFTFSATRTLLFILAYFWCEIVGVVIATLLWCLRPVLSREGYLGANFRLQCGWGSALYDIGGFLFGFTTHLEGEEVLHSAPNRPILLFIKHSSLADTALAVRFVSQPLGVRLRYVLKRPLLLDPCLDIVGNRLLNWFSTHASANRERELTSIAALAADLKPREGVLIYPEGTRFSRRKKSLQTRTIERRHGAGSAELAAAHAMSNVLLPRHGGPIALLLHALRSDPPIDVVFCSHTGFEGSATFASLFAGALVDQEVYVKFWRVANEEIPRDEERLYPWLLDHWHQVDDFVEQRRCRSEEPVSA